VYNTHTLQKEEVFVFHDKEIPPTGHAYILYMGGGWGGGQFSRN
jgi:hypothetical protein